MNGDSLPLDSWSNQASRLLAGLGKEALALSASGIGHGAPVGTAPGGIAVRAARFGVNIELSRAKDGGWLWFFRRGAEGDPDTWARARIRFALGPALAPARPARVLAEERLMPPMLLAGLDRATLAALFGAEAAAARPVVFAEDGQPIVAAMPGRGWVLPGSATQLTRLPRGPGLALLRALAASRPSLADAASAGPSLPGVAGQRFDLLLRAARALGGAHADAALRLAALPSLPESAALSLSGYGLGPTQGVIEFKLDQTGKVPDDADALADAMTVAISVSVETPPPAEPEAAQPVRMRLSLAPPDVLAEGRVFDAFARAIADAADDATFAATLAPALPRAALADAGNARLVFRYSRRRGDDLDLVVWANPGGPDALFSVRAKVVGGNLDPSVSVQAPELHSDPELPRDASQRLMQLAAVLGNWIGEAP